MLFHSNDFLAFLGVFLLGFALCRHHIAARNLLILVASYIFYGWWDYRFVLLLLFSSVMDFFLGLAIDRAGTPTLRRLLLVASVVVNLGLLSFFKYLDFFGETAANALSAAGWNVTWTPWRLLLPVGISFYTFQSMSYVIDVYRRELPATTNLVRFLSYVAFFPQLVAGPIERATHLLPQFSRPLTIDAGKIERGLWLILWGLFKKVALADNFAPLAEMVFKDATPTGPAVILGALAFALQIYCDFSAYSEIARGVANLLGVELMVNFNLPYFALDLRDFWRRWHISLSTWLRDYLYIPLGGGRRGRGRTYLNLLITMLLAGLWHGAAPQFVLWGLWHGAGLALSRWWSGWPRAWRLPHALSWALTIVFVLYGWLLFRAESLERIEIMTRALARWDWPPWTGAFIQNLACLATPLFLVETWQHRQQDLFAPLRLPFWGRALLQGGLLLAIVVFWEREASPFIYFQF